MTLYSLCCLFCSFLGKRGIKDDICMFDARSIPPDVRESVEELLKSKASSFDPKVRCLIFNLNLHPPPCESKTLLHFLLLVQIIFIPYCRGSNLTAFYLMTAAVHES